MAQRAHRNLPDGGHVAKGEGPRAVWVSHGYGYGGDMMYFGEIFRALRERLPRMAVVTDRDTDFDNPYSIELLPIMHLWRRAVSRTAPDGQDYETEVTIPRPAFASALRRLDADILIAIEFTAPALVATAVAALSRRTRLLLLVESDPAARGASRNPIVRRIKRWAVGRADAIQTNNAAGLRYLVEDLGADPAKIDVAPYLTSRPPGPDPDLGLVDGPLRLLFANSLVRRKGAREMLTALALLEPKERAQIDLTIVGDGTERTGLEEIAAGLDMGKRLRFAGRVPYSELGQFYGAADVLVIPSLADYRSLVGFEGLGYGLALLASDKDGATAETVVEGVTGYAFAPSDPAALAARLKELVEDRSKLMKMRRAALQLYESRYSLNQIAANISRSVRRAIGD